MRGVCERRAIAILTKSRGPGSWCQSFSFSSGRGRGRGDGDGPPFFGIGGKGGGSGIGEGAGVGRGRGSVIPAPPFVSAQPPPFKPFKLDPTEPRPNSAAETPAPSQQVYAFDHACPFWFPQCLSSPCMMNVTLPYCQGLVGDPLSIWHSKFAYT